MAEARSRSARTSPATGFALTNNCHLSAIKLFSLVCRVLRARTCSISIRSSLAIDGNLLPYTPRISAVAIIASAPSVAGISRLFQFSTRKSLVLPKSLNVSTSSTAPFASLSASLLRESFSWTSAAFSILNATLGSVSCKVGARLSPPSTTISCAAARIEATSAFV